jgi:glycosyltransferase involved in cell wall biosynthesis
MLHVNATRRVGFIIDGHLPDWDAVWQRRCYPWSPLTGWHSRSSIGTMRFEWIATELNRHEPQTVTYELYKPWRGYDAVVFLKSMNDASIRLAERLKKKATSVIFDLNVDYLTPASGHFYYDTMRPSETQREAAVTLATLSDAVIADSSYLAAAAAHYNGRVRWIPDNVNFELAPEWTPSNPKGKMTLFWSGEAIKLFELLRIEDVLREFADRIKLVLITNSLNALDRWYDGNKERFQALLASVEHEIIPFQSVEGLMEVYRRGGISISPRYLDNSYNLGHTEWKIALAMACGRMALCSPVPSYLDVQKRANGAGIRVCRSDDEWRAAFDEILTRRGSMQEEEMAARVVIERFYSTPVVAREHRDFMLSVLSKLEASRN